MENQILPKPETDLFEVTLSAEGAGYINRAFKLTRWLFLLGIIMSVVQLANIGIRFRMYYRPALQTGDPLVILTAIYPIFEVLIVVLTLFQLYFFYNFTRIGNKSIELQQSEMFNESFKWLLKETRLATILFVIETILLIVGLYSQYKLFAKMP